jgi:hypothetical protein
LTNPLPIGRLRRNRHIGALEQRRREREKTTCTDQTQRHSVSDMPGALREMAPAYRAGRAIHLGTARPLAHQWSVVYGRPAQAFLQKDGNGKISPAPLKTDALSSLPMKSTLVAVQKAASTFPTRLRLRSALSASRRA